MAITIHKEKKQKKNKKKRDFKKIINYILDHRIIFAGGLVAILAIAGLLIFFLYPKSKPSTGGKQIVSQKKPENKTQNIPTTTNQPQTENNQTQSTTPNTDTSGPTTSENTTPPTSEEQEKQKILAVSNNWMIANYREKAVNLTYNIVSYSISQATVVVTGNLNATLYLTRKDSGEWYVYSPTPP